MRSVNFLFSLKERAVHFYNHLFHGSGIVAALNTGHMTLFGEQDGKVARFQLAGGGKSRIEFVETAIFFRIEQSLFLQGCQRRIVDVFRAGKQRLQIDKILVIFNSTFRKFFGGVFLHAGIDKPFFENVFAVGNIRRESPQELDCLTEFRSVAVRHITPPESEIIINHNFIFLCWLKIYMFIEVFCKPVKSEIVEVTAVDQTLIPVDAKQFHAVDKLNVAVAVFPAAFDFIALKFAGLTV